MGKTTEEQEAQQHSSEFLERRQLIEFDLSASREKHQMRMTELQYARETEQIKHENEMTRNRIKSAEIRKSQERKFGEQRR